MNVNHIFIHGQIRVFLTSNCHTLRSYSRGCVIATEIFFYQKHAEIPKDNDKIQRFIEKIV